MLRERRGNNRYVGMINCHVTVSCIGLQNGTDLKVEWYQVLLSLYALVSIYQWISEQKWLKGCKDGTGLSCRDVSLSIRRIDKFTSLQCKFINQENCHWISTGQFKSPRFEVTVMGEGLSPQVYINHCPELPWMIQLDWVVLKTYILISKLRHAWINLKQLGLA